MSRKRQADGRRPVTVEWGIEAPYEPLVDRDLLQAVLSLALSAGDLAPSLEIGLTIAGDTRLRDLNRMHRGLDSPTDVLSFPLLEFDAPGKPRPNLPAPPGEPLPLGDIVISYDRAVEQATTYGHSLRRELAFLAVHGAMHLLGYDHEKPDDQLAMRAEEERVLGELGLTR